MFYFRLIFSKKLVFGGNYIKFVLTVYENLEKTFQLYQTITFQETARLSFVSSSTGYSSARSSLRSSDGGDESNNNSAGNRDSAISNTFSLSSQSSARRSALLTKGSLTHLDRIAIELLDTERTYVEDLNAVIKGYMDFLVEDREKLKVTLDAISSLFGCIERIFAFNKQLYNQLDAADLDCVKVC